MKKLKDQIIKKICLFFLDIFKDSENFFLFRQRQKIFLYINNKQKIKCNIPNTFYYDSLPRIFVIGHNKSGTNSIYELFINNGYKSYHWEKDLLSHKIKQNFFSNSLLLRGIENAHLYSDIECGSGLSYEYNLFPQLDLQYPGSFFIYNYRDITEWLVSRTNHDNGKYINRCIKNLNNIYGYNFNNYDDIYKHWKSYFYRHQSMIKNYFKDKNNLIVLNLDNTESKIDFCRKLKNIGFKIKDSTLPHVKFPFKNNRIN